MKEICGDNRFEIIARAKKALLEGTNIDTSPDEMAVIDDILFRCWQMGWLDRYDRKDEPQTENLFTDKYGDVWEWRGDAWYCISEQDEPQTIRCPKCGRTDYIRDMEKDMGIKGSHYKYKCINCNTYIKDEPQLHMDGYYRKDEPQTDCAWRKGE